VQEPFSEQKQLPFVCVGEKISGSFGIDKGGTIECGSALCAIELVFLKILQIAHASCMHS
jgi:hypothetical protein